MKIAIELPDAMFRQAKALAAARRTTLKQFFTDALDEKLRRCARERSAREPEPPWMAAFGGLSELSSEHRRVNATIEEEFEWPGVPVAALPYNGAVSRKGRSR